MTRESRMHLETRLRPFGEALRERRELARFRSLEHYTPVPGTPYVEDTDGHRLVSFSSNDYLGFATDPETIEAAARAAETHGAGAGASRLVAGSFDLHRALEEELADFTGRGGALLFNSGFQANVSIIPALVGRSGLILSDEGVHNSLIQGCRLSRAKVRRFRHNDPAHLDALLGEAARIADATRSAGTTRTADTTRLIVTESLFSMDGDRAPLDEICEVAERHGALLLVDDAHAFGVMGRDGRGLASAHERVDLVVGTFGKALGSSGAFVACDGVLRDHLVNFGSGFIYSTAPPPPSIGAVRSGLERIRSGAIDLAAFAHRVRTTHERLRAAGFDTSPSDTHIVPIRLGGEHAALDCARFLRDRGILAVGIRPPTVPKGTSRIRISLSRLHGEAHVERLVSALSDYAAVARASETGRGGGATGTSVAGSPEMDRAERAPGRTGP